MSIGKKRTQTLSESSASPTLKRRDELQQVTPELIVRKRARLVSEEEDIGQSRNKQARMESKIDRLLNEMGQLKDRVATKEDLGAVNKKIEDMEVKQAAMSNSQAEIQARLDRLERGANRTEGKGGASEKKESPREIVAFIDARRSLIVSPTMPSLPNVKDFFLNEMKLPKDLVDDLQITNIRKIYPRRLPAHRIRNDDTKKVSLMLRDAHERDVVISYAANLSREARIDIVVPDHLLSLKAQFDALSYRLRKHVTLTSGNKVQTSLRLDDKSQSLIMAVRMNREDQWLHYSLKELQELEDKLVGGRSGKGGCEDGDEDAV